MSNFLFTFTLPQEDIDNLGEYYLAGNTYVRHDSQLRKSSGLCPAVKEWAITADLTDSNEVLEYCLNNMQLLDMEILPNPIKD